MESASSGRADQTEVKDERNERGEKSGGESSRRNRPQGRFIEICCRWWEFPTSLIAAQIHGHGLTLAGSLDALYIVVTHSYP